MKFTIEDFSLFKQIADGNFRLARINYSKVVSWTKEDIAKLIPDEALIDKFFENLELTGIPKSERRIRALYAAYNEAAKNVAVFRGTLYFKNGNVWEHSKDSVFKLLYNVLTIDARKHIEGFLKHLELYNHDFKTFDTMDIRYIAVGDKFFDVEEGKMVSEAPDELRTFALPTVDYKPMRLEDCEGEVMRRLIKLMGFDNLRYLMQVTARSMLGFRDYKNAYFIIGTARELFGDVLKTIGLAPSQDMGKEFSKGNRFMETYADTAAHYPVIFVRDCKDYNISEIKSACSNAHTTCDIRWKPAVQIPNRATLMFACEEFPFSADFGVYDKFKFLIASGHRYDDRCYATAEECNEFICVLLTMCSALHNNPHIRMTPEMEWTHKELSRDCFPDDTFQSEWVDSSEVTPVIEAYRQYVVFNDPYLSDEAVDVIVSNQGCTPDVGDERIVSLDTFVNEVMQYRELVTVNGVRCFKGKPTSLFGGI